MAKYDIFFLDLLNCVLSLSELLMIMKHTVGST